MWKRLRRVVDWVGNIGTVKDLPGVVGFIWNLLWPLCAVTVFVVTAAGRLPLEVSIPLALLSMCLCLVFIRLLVSVILYVRLARSDIGVVLDNVQMSGVCEPPPHKLTNLFWVVLAMDLTTRDRAVTVEIRLALEPWHGQKLTVQADEAVFPGMPKPIAVVHNMRTGPFLGRVLNIDPFRTVQGVAFFTLSRALAEGLGVKDIEDALMQPWYVDLVDKTNGKIKRYDPWNWATWRKPETTPT